MRTIEELFTANLAQYENAQADLYYGYSRESWKEHNMGDMTDEEANALWEAARDEMADNSWCVWKVDKYGCHERFTPSYNGSKRMCQVYIRNKEKKYQKYYKIERTQGW